MQWNLRLHQKRKSVFYHLINAGIFTRWWKLIIVHFLLTSSFSVALGFPYNWQCLNFCTKSSFFCLSQGPKNAKGSISDFWFSSASQGGQFLANQIWLACLQRHCVNHLYSRRSTLCVFLLFQAIIPCSCFVFWNMLQHKTVWLFCIFTLIFVFWPLAVLQHWRLFFLYYIWQMGQNTPF